MTTVIDFIRHGTPEGGRLYRGSTIDDPLGEKGWQQMWRAVGDLCHWDAIVSSPLRRCLAFAEALGERHGLPAPKTSWPSVSGWPMPWNAPSESTGTGGCWWWPTPE